MTHFTWPKYLLFLTDTSEQKNKSGFDNIFEPNWEVSVKSGFEFYLGFAPHCTLLSYIAYDNKYIIIFYNQKQLQK